ncbi:MAG: hypothetical protein FJY65_10595 [Calditrichaeota bacterium]|nr:hypothetical protein [Calditrichota bacterium]
MFWLYRELSGVLLPEQTKALDEDIAGINGLPNPPPVPVTARDVYIRRCRLAGDAVDAGFGRFRSEDLPRLLQMAQGAPALIGHKREGLGVARFFGGSLQTDPRSGITYIVPKFYWMRNHSAAEDLRVNIDGGIWCEASLGFTFRKPTCSVCGEDIRRCEHTPGTRVGDAVCFFYYDDIIKVTEGSIVYRGAQPGTGFMLAGQPPAIDLSNLPRFRWEGIWYRGLQEKLIV